MALAKLLKMHRRTDFEEIMHFYDKLMRPEHYKTQAAKANELLVRLLSTYEVLTQKGIKPYF